MRKQWLWLVLLCVGLSTQVAYGQQNEPNDAEGDVRYVSDDLFIFMHAGPGRNYRILGSVMAGTPITVLQTDDEKGFMEVIDDKQRTGWVETRFVTNQTSLREMLPQVQAELQRVNTLVANSGQVNDQLKNELSQVQQQRDQLIKQVSELTDKNQTIQRELDQQDKTEQMQWFTRGGGIALIGIILGVIIAYLPKKRRRNDQWM